MSTWVMKVLIAFGKALLISLSILFGSCLIRFIYRFWIKRLGCYEKPDDLSESCKYEMELQSAQEMNHTTPLPRASPAHDAVSEIELPPSPGANTSCPPYNTNSLTPLRGRSGDYSDSFSGIWRHHAASDAGETTSAELTSVAGETTTMCSMLTMGGNEETGSEAASSAATATTTLPPPPPPPPQPPPSSSSAAVATAVIESPSLSKTILPPPPSYQQVAASALPLQTSSAASSSPIYSSASRPVRSPPPPVPGEYHQPHYPKPSSSRPCSMTEFQDYQSYVPVSIVSTGSAVSLPASTKTYRPPLPPPPKPPSQQQQPQPQPQPQQQQQQQHDRGTELFLSQYYKSLDQDDCYENGRSSKSPPPV